MASLFGTPSKIDPSPASAYAVERPTASPALFVEPMAPQVGAPVARRARFMIKE